MFESLVFLAGSGFTTDLNNWIQTELATAGSVFSFLLVFIGGFAASLLPCVYPLYPITAGIIGARAKEGKKLHSFTYFSGLSFMYFLFGVVAAVSGGAFNQVMRYPATNIAIGIVLFLLALSTIELLHIPFFHPHGIGMDNKGLGGTFLMGMGAGFLSSPCVGPVVVSVLLQLTASASANPSFAMMAQTSLKMFVFGAGLGLPFLFVSLFGLKLPRSGKWMRYVQLVLAGLIVYFAYGFLQKGFLSANPGSTSHVHYILGFLLVLACGFFIQKEGSTQERMAKSVFFSGMVLGLALIFSAPSGALPPQATGNMETHGNLQWNRDKQQAYTIAATSGKKIFIDFFADWCTNCKEFSELTLADEGLNRALSASVLLKIYDTDPDFEKYAADERFQELNIGLPFFVVLDANGNLLYKTSNYLDKDEMIRHLK